VSASCCHRYAKTRLGETLEVKKPFFSQMRSINLAQTALETEFESFFFKIGLQVKKNSTYLPRKSPVTGLKK
jgi:hypothetical protein